MIPTDHTWETLAELGIFHTTGEKVKVRWCHRCGSVVSGPFAEPGAHRYFVYGQIGRPWTQKAGEELTQEPPCSHHLSGPTVCML